MSHNDSIPTREEQLEQEHETMEEAYREMRKEREKKARKEAAQTTPTVGGASYEPHKTETCLRCEKEFNLSEAEEVGPTGYDNGTSKMVATMVRCTHCGFRQ